MEKTGSQCFESHSDPLIIIILVDACSRSQIASIVSYIELIFFPLQFLYSAVIKLPLSLLSYCSSVSLYKMGSASGLELAKRKCLCEVKQYLSTLETKITNPKSISSMLLMVLQVAAAAHLAWQWLWMSPVSHIPRGAHSSLASISKWARKDSSLASSFFSVNPILQRHVLLCQCLHQKRVLGWLPCFSCSSGTLLCTWNMLKRLGSWILSRSMFFCSGDRADAHRPRPWAFVFSALLS